MLIVNIITSRLYRAQARIDRIGRTLRRSSRFSDGRNTEGRSLALDKRGGARDERLDAIELEALCDNSPEGR